MKIDNLSPALVKRLNQSFHLISKLAGDKKAELQDLLVLEELVDADAVDAFRVGANVLLDLAALAGETGRTVAAEVTN